MSLSPQVALMKRPIDEISVSDAGGGDLRDSAMVVDNAAFESHLASCVRLTTSSSYKQTWELQRGGPPLLHEFTTANRLGQLPMLPEVIDIVECTPAIVDTHVFRLRRSIDSRSWEAKLGAHLVAAIRKWAGIILVFPLAFEIGRNFVVNSGTMANGLHETLHDVFAGKSSGTLHNRANPMIRFAAWCKANGYDPFPLDEDVCYRFALSSEHSAPTFLRSFLVSITFSFHILGLTGGETCMKSSRLQGAARKSYLRKRKREQRDPLTVEQVRKLELLASGDIPGGKTDRLAAWFFLTCVYMRARYSDGLNLTGLFIDCPEPRKEPLYGFIEGTVGRTKTAYTRNLSWLLVAEGRQEKTGHQEVWHCVVQSAFVWRKGFLCCRLRRGLDGRGPRYPLGKLACGFEACWWAWAKAQMISRRWGRILVRLLALAG